LRVDVAAIGILGELEVVVVHRDLMLAHAEGATDADDDGSNLAAWLSTTSLMLPTVSLAAFTTDVPISLLARISPA
jgi:hypothetical protein